MNNRLRLECLAAVSKVFRDFNEPIADDLLANIVFALPQELVTANGNGHAYASGRTGHWSTAPESPLKPTVPPESPKQPGVPPESPKAGQPANPPDQPKPVRNPGIRRIIRSLRSPRIRRINQARSEAR
jgi:hypothetical protein